jgi:LPXTG-motif cell wall-anchored protein
VDGDDDDYSDYGWIGLFGLIGLLGLLGLRKNNKEVIMHTTNTPGNNPSSTNKY